MNNFNSLPMCLTDCKKILILDGGLSNVLRKYVKFDIDSDPLWTARALVDSPEAIVQVHLDYLEAGADIISTCSYQASLPGFSKYLDLNPAEGIALIRKSVDLAKQAVDKFTKGGNFGIGRQRPFIAGSVGPYGAYLCDRSEYTGKYMNEVSEEELTTFHSPRLSALIDAGVDLLLLETNPSVQEVEILLKIIKQLTPLPTIISFSVDSSFEESSDTLTTSYGDDIKTILNLVMNHTSVIGFGINCCNPEAVQKFLDLSTKEAKSIPGFEIEKYKRIVYPNKGKWSSNHRTLENGASSLDNYVQQWLSSGGTIIGGCCQVGPSEINGIRKVIDSVLFK